MVAEHKVTAGGHNIHPVTVDADDVRFAANHGAGDGSFPGAGGNLHGNKAGIVFADAFFLFDDGEATSAGEYVGIDQINPFLAYTLQTLVITLAGTIPLYAMNLKLGDLLRLTQSAPQDDNGS